MFRNLSFCLVALLAASPALAQSVVVSESALQVQPLSPSLGTTESLAIITPNQAEALIDGTATPTPVPAAVQTIILPDESAQALSTLPRISPQEVEILIEEPLVVDPNAERAEQDVSLYVMEEGTILPSASWTARDSEACKAAGGIELPLPSNRIGCFKL